MKRSLFTAVPFLAIVSLPHDLHLLKMGTTIEANHW